MFSPDKGERKRNVWNHHLGPRYVKASPPTSLIIAQPIKTPGVTRLHGPLNKRFAIGYFLSLGTSTGSVFTYLEFPENVVMSILGSTPPKTNMTLKKNEDVSPIKNGEVPTSHLSFLGGGWPKYGIWKNLSWKSTLFPSRSVKRLGLPNVVRELEDQRYPPGN